MRNIKRYSLIATILLFSAGAFAQGLNKYGQIITNPAAYLNKNGAVGSTTGLSKSGQQFNVPPAPGVPYQGGTIVYIFQNGDAGYVAGETHGLIASNEDVGYSQWGCRGTTTAATGIAIGTGSSNTALIMASCSDANIPAKLCADYRGGDYTDWYLPSKDELKKIYLSRSLLSNVNSYLYWSSSEFSSAETWRQNLSVGNGSQQQFGKNSNSHVRAMRTF
ncbi:hypothetical protein PBAL39_00020 [Pedobacter sp. BAL39]|uniref:DUF1566 domain-containing protein n=1 Tax=Pedobacter sp. BAL39 TaxID=391596 RepID=UPI0001559D64|nr:DUF1566 domain-containing protein [Pedobacter sp. BAL39]EDM34870.1 hypothetical protein PBAL39_00020 [Pedobacter sp. BAL39]